MENESTTITPTEDVESVYLITFILLLIVEIPSIVCILIILPYFFCHWHSMMTKALHIHVIFLLIIVSFFYVTIDLPFKMNHYRLGYDNYRKPSFCLVWYWLDYTLLAVSLYLTAAGSVQQHIVVANIALVYRVIYLMRKICQRRIRTWQKQKKLTLQLLAFSSLYIIGWGPSMVISIVETTFLPNLYNERPELYYINNSSYFICPLQPIICFFSIPKLMKFVKSKLGRKRPVTTTTASSFLK